MRPVHGSMIVRNVFMDTAREERRERLFWKTAAIIVGLLLIIIAGVLLDVAHAEPQAALRYRADTIRTTRAVWGMSGPVAVFAGQIQQESGWNPAAHSSVADGLAEFTPSTATWISGAYHLGSAEPYNPAWALRALVTYDKDLWDKVTGYPPPAATGCDHMAFTLSAYNGGIGWIPRDRRTASQFGIANTGVWFDAVELFSSRSATAFKENRGYPRRILLTLQGAYSSWGPKVECSVAVTQEHVAWLQLSRS